MRDFNDPAYRSHLQWNYSFTLPFEESYNPLEEIKRHQTIWPISIAASIVYLMVIFFGQKAMKNRAPLKLKGPLLFWNMGLAAFSILGLVRFGPQFLWVIRNLGFHRSICLTTHVPGIPGIWTYLFMYSKIVELGDTMFLVLRKRPVIFLHWYHHISVMIYTFHGYQDQAAAGIWFIAMNLGVHSFMYTYYTFSAGGIRPPKPISMSITLLQITQMFIGLGVSGTAAVTKFLGGTCEQSRGNAIMALLMYLSYLVLFIQFFHRAYFAPRPPKAKIEDEIALKKQIIEKIENESFISNGIPTRNVRKSKGD